MAIHIKTHRGVYPDNHQELICDYTSDITELPIKGYVTGSTAFVIEDSSTYMLNGSGAWKKISCTATSNSSSGGTIDESDIATDDEVDDMLNDVFSD